MEPELVSAAFQGGATIVAAVIGLFAVARQQAIAREAAQREERRRLVDPFLERAHARLEAFNWLILTLPLAKAGSAGPFSRAYNEALSQPSLYQARLAAPCIRGRRSPEWLSCL